MMEFICVFGLILPKTSLISSGLFVMGVQKSHARHSVKRMEEKE